MFFFNSFHCSTGFGGAPDSTFQRAITKTKESKAHGENAEADDGLALRHSIFAPWPSNLAAKDCKGV